MKSEKKLHKRAKFNIYNVASIVNGKIEIKIFFDKFDLVYLKRAAAQIFEAAGVGRQGENHAVAVECLTLFAELFVRAMMGAV